MLVQIDKTKVMVFNTNQGWVTSSEPDFFLGEEMVAYAQSCTYLCLAFTGLSSHYGRVYAALDANVHMYTCHTDSSLCSRNFRIDS